MSLPNLLHPTMISIQTIDRAGTRYDADAREPIQNARRGAAVVVPGQVSWLGGDSLKVDDAGPTIDANGYVLFRYVDLDAVSITLQIGDRFTGLGRDVEEVYVTGLRPVMHYPDQNGPSGVRAYFKDRRPAKERGA